MNFLKTTITAALVGFASLAQAADNWTVSAFISRMYLDNRASSYNYQVYLKDATTGNAITTVCSNGGSSAYAYINRGSDDAEWMVAQLRTARFTMTPVKLYVSPAGSGCKILIIDHD